MAKLEGLSNFKYKKSYWKWALKEILNEAS